MERISPNDVTHRPNPQKDRPWAEPRHLSHKPRKSVARGSSWAFERGKNKTGQEKSHERVIFIIISPICGEAPTEVHENLCSG